MKVGTLRQAGALMGLATVALTMATVVSQAAVTFTTPNSTVLSFSLTPGGTSAGINPPVVSGVLLLGIDSSSNNFGIGSVNLVHIQSTEIRWVGLESNGAVTHGGTTTPGAHVVYLDASRKVDVQILSADELVVHNAGTTTQAVKIKLIW